MDELYVKCKGKAREDKNVYTKEQVKSPTFTSDYGRIVPPGYVVFDFDKQPYINIIYKILTNSKLKCKMLKTTKGYHFMFRTALNKVPDGIALFNWLGLQCDTKACGTKEQKQSYQTIRINGETREESLLNTSDEWDLDYAPRWLYSVSNKKKDQMDLTVDQTGGRNNLFHSELMIKAKKAGFSYEEYCEMCFIINQYVLPNPIDENELNTAIRPEEWDNLEIGEDIKTVLVQADDVIQHWNCILGDDKFAFYDPELDRYSNNENTIKYYLQQKYGYTEKSMTMSKIEEVLDQVNLVLTGLSKYKYARNTEYILCDKELVSTWKDEVKPNTRTVYTDVYYPYSFMSKEEFEAFDGRAKKFIKEISCFDEEIERVIWECIGCMLAPDKPFGKIFIFYGSGNNGKSLLLKLVEKIMGELMSHANVLNINDKFSLESVVGRLANVTDDIGITVLKETGLLKSLVDGSSIEVHRKFKESIHWTPNSQFVLCCNELPRINDTTHGMIRRLGFIPFDLHLKEEDIDRTLFSKMISDPNNLRYIMSGGIYAYREAYKRGSLSRLGKQIELEQDFIEENQNPIKAFYDIKVSENADVLGLSRWIDGKTTDEVYTEYTKWCEKTGIKPDTRNTFTREFSKYLPSDITKKVISLNGVKFNCYQRNTGKVK